jgi:hypothetical protein
VSVPLYYGFVELVVLAAFSLWAWKSGWTYAPAAARDVLFPVGTTTTQKITEARRACILHVAQRILSIFCDGFTRLELRGFDGASNK